jgi:aspartate/methionine/tyrosine aminotransferase
MVSKRGNRLAADQPPIARAHFQAEADAFHHRRNPGGYVNLGTAENRLAWDLLAPMLSGPRRVSAADTRYGQLHGTPETRATIARFLSRTRGIEIDPDDLILVSGATAALDIIASVICDPGDAIVVPAPYYGAFDTDLCARSEVRLVPAPQTSATGFRSVSTAVARAVERAERDGTNVRAVCFSSPYNPVGHVYTEREVRELAYVIERHNLALIADELYANSVFGSAPFVSLLDPPRPAHPGRVHVVWGAAKDLGLPGLKVGVLHTRDPQVRTAARALAYFAPVSTDTQALLRQLLADDEWVDAFLKQSRARLAASYVRARWQLRDHEIPVIPAEAGFSLWCDLRALLPAPSFAAERALWRDIYDRERVNILPGELFGCPEAGWFRLCHTTSARILDEGIARLGRFRSRRQAAAFTRPLPAVVGW